MNVFPMIRTRLSNEHIMASVLLVLILYHLPLWVAEPVGILRFVLLVGFGLFLDAIVSFLRFRRLWCCISGGITAAMISLLTAGIPIWAQLLAIAFGLLAGKHLYGGTGKNISNPAMVGMIVILLFFDLPDKLFPASLLLLPAVLLGLIFLFIRPFAGIAFLVGMLTAMLLNNQLSFDNVLSYGVFFWACLVITDPVTVTPKPVKGLVLGLILSFSAVYFFRMPGIMVTVILIINIFSEEMLEQPEKNRRGMTARVRIPKPYLQSEAEAGMIDLTGQGERSEVIRSAKELTAEEILEGIKDYEIFGMGGAAFSTWQKLKTVMASEAADKYLIINAVECDPGLIHDKWLLINRFTDISKGIELLDACVKFKEIHLAVKDTGDFLQSMLIKVDQVPELYPAGAEKILIQEVLDKRLTPDQIPAASGILVLNLQTVYTICLAVLYHESTNTRYLTVADVKNKTAKVVRVRLGTMLSTVMEAVFPGTVNIYAGGGIMQAFLAQEDAVVDRNVNFIATGRMPRYKESPQCSRCGLCQKHCPGRLEVRRIADLVDKGKLQETLKFKAVECISCGSCSYSCPAGHNLAVRVKQAKDFAILKKEK